MPIPKLLQLARDNAAASKPLRAEASGDEATIYLHGVIGGWWGDIDETEFVKALAGITADTIHLRIDSPGGDVFGARAMMTAIAVVTARAPTLEEQHDIDFGRGLARSIAQLRIGQTVVVKRRTVLAVEAMEGTDAAIRRGGTLGNGGVVVVKVGRPDQDMRFDLPVIGPETVAALEDAGATALALDGDQTLMLEREKVVAKADQLGLAIVAD